MEIQKTKQKLQVLIDQVLEKNEQQKQNLSFLFRKLEEVKELENLEQLSEAENRKYLKAFLLYKSITRANFQTEHLKLTDFTESEKYLEAINRDLEDLEKSTPLPKYQPTNQQLLTLLGERIAKGEIKSEIGYLSVQKEEKITVDLETGKIEPDPAKEFFKRHQNSNN